MRVMIYDEQHEEDLMDDINTFLMKYPNIKIISMHYATCCMSVSEEQIYCFSCMIVYDERTCT